MAIITLCSASGSPGVTTTTLAVALNLNRPTLVIEADTNVSSSMLPGIFRGNIAHTKGLTNLVLAQQNGSLTMAETWEQAIPLTEAVRVVPGLNSRLAAAGTRSLWPALAEALSYANEYGVDVVVDLGRLAVNDARIALLKASDLVLLCLHPNLPGVAAASQVVPELQSALEPVGQVGNLNLCLVHSTGETYSQKEIARQLGTNVLAELADSSVVAAYYSRGEQAPKGAMKSDYQRAISLLVSAIRNHLQLRDSELGHRLHHEVGGEAIA